MLLATAYYPVRVMRATLKRGLIGCGIWPWQDSRASPDAKHDSSERPSLPSAEPATMERPDLLTQGASAVSWAEEAPQLMTNREAWQSRTDLGAMHAGTNANAG
jgi:hypothetical protein